MAEPTLTLLEDGRSHTLPFTREADRTRIETAALEAALGWSLKPEGLCKGDVCVPTRSQPDLASGAGVDLGRFAELLGLPLAEDLAEGVASLGPAHATQGQALATGQAPDFTLPDLAGVEHSLSGFRGKKVLLVAYASW